MTELYYDLHIHSCLSPCGDDDMTPANIAGMAAVKGLDVIAVTDHNSCKNCPAVLAAAAEYGILAIPGMEINTSEEVHAVCLFEELKNANPAVYKIFLFSSDVVMLKRLSAVLSKDRRIAVAASFETNLEITDVRAQKGPVLKAYIESLGYTMDEVMVLGDSTNDFSMLSMDFGATVAMGNAMPEVKEAAKYVTRTNQEGGVAYTIDCLLKKV